LGFRIGTEHKINIRQDNTIEKLNGAGYTRTYGDEGAAHLRETKTIAANHDLDPDGALAERQLSLPDTRGIANFGKNGNVAQGTDSIIYQENSSLNADMHDSLTYTDARFAAEDILQGMTDQARALEAFFAGASGNEKFARLKNAEGARGTGRRRNA
jgi:hypothetical protein